MSYEEEDTCIHTTSLLGGDDTHTDYEREKKSSLGLRGEKGNLPALNASHQLGFKLIFLGFLGHERQVFLRLQNECAGEGSGFRV